MEYEHDNDQGEGLWQRLKESPRTVSALIIILIVAAAIYAFSGNQPKQTQPPGEVAEEEGAMEASEPGAEQTPADQQAAATPQATLTPVEQQTLRQAAESLPAGSRDDQGYRETAQAGDGITHLARRAATRWLAENDAGYQVTNEHRIYIEDYIQNNIGTEGLQIGETRTVTYDLVRQAVEAAGRLNDQQLRNLTQYTSALG